MNQLDTSKKSALASVRSGLRRAHRNERGDVLPKVFLTIIALGGIIALGTIVTKAMGLLDGNMTKTVEKTTDVADDTW